LSGAEIPAHPDGLAGIFIKTDSKLLQKAYNIQFVSKININLAKLMMEEFQMNYKQLRVMLFLMAIVFISATTINNFFMPGSQPGQSGNIESPDKCDNCHGGYDANVEPAFNWRGSMMAQAARDPLFWACLAIAEQDAPGSGDLCIRCHAPDGWLNGRSEPTDGSRLNSNDRQGVQCDFCHKLVKPSMIGFNPYPNDTYYTNETYAQDQSYLAELMIIPGSSSNGMYIADKTNAKRGPYWDATGRHKMFYSPFHRESAICGTCHDVSNPAFTRPDVNTAEYTFNGYDNLPTSFDLRLQFPIERTFSEWMISDYSKPGGKSCQSCHMMAVTGKGAKMKDAKVRTDLALHDMTGGNTFIPDLVKHLFPGEVDHAALDAGKERAKKQLESAADISLEVNGQMAIVKVTNKTGHKLPSGYPEGRRIWVNLRAFKNNVLVFESGAYNHETADLAITGTKIYETKPGFSADWATAINKEVGPSFHFAINNKIHFDNRIPPRGATNALLNEIQSPVIGYTYADGQYWDETTYNIPNGFDRVEANLYYQTLSKEYVTFLRDENRTNNTGQQLYSLWEMYGKSAPVLMNRVTYSDGSSEGIVQEIMVKNFDVVKKAANGGRVLAEANILITRKDANFTPVADVLVTATWRYGNQSGTVSGTTQANGTVTLASQSLKNATGEWCFTLENVILKGHSFDGENTHACTPTTKESLAFATDLSMLVFPNPVSGMATIRYIPVSDSEIVIEVYNVRGRKVDVLYNKDTMAGREAAIQWDTSHLSPGYYMLRLMNGNHVTTETVIVR
jgi:hypothetical protein